MKYVLWLHYDHNPLAYTQSAYILTPFTFGANVPHETLTTCHSALAPLISFDDPNFTAISVLQCYDSSGDWTVSKRWHHVPTSTGHHTLTSHVHTASDWSEKPRCAPTLSHMSRYIIFICNNSWNFLLPIKWDRPRHERLRRSCSVMGVCTVDTK